MKKYSIIAHVCHLSAETVTSNDPADVPGILYSEAGTVHDQVLQHFGTVLQLHAGELCMPASGKINVHKKNRLFSVEIQI